MCGTPDNIYSMKHLTRTNGWIRLPLENHSCELIYTTSTVKYHHIIDAFSKYTKLYCSTDHCLHFGRDSVSFQAEYELVESKGKSAALLRNYRQQKTIGSNSTIMGFKRILDNTGFHKNLKTEIKIDGNACNATIIEFITDEVYVDIADLGKVY